MEAAQGAFEQTVRELGVEINHDVLGCRDCRWVLSRREVSARQDAMTYLVRVRGLLVDGES